MRAPRREMGGSEMRVTRTTEIDGRNIPIEAGEPPVVCFLRGASGEHEAGPWEFWSLESEAGKPKFGGCRPRSDRGQRFRDTSPAELAEYRENLATATKIRPATKSEVEGWLNAHKGDVAETAYIAGQAMRIVPTGFLCEPIPLE